MSKQNIEKNWNSIENQIKERWGKFRDEDVEELKNNLDNVVGKLQKIYGYTLEEAKKEYKEFKSTISKLMKDPKNRKIVYAALGVVAFLVPATLVTTYFLSHRKEKESDIKSCI